MIWLFQELGQCKARPSFFFVLVLQQIVVHYIKTILEVYNKSALTPLQASLVYKKNHITLVIYIFVLEVYHMSDMSDKKSITVSADMLFLRTRLCDMLLVCH